MQEDKTTRTVNWQFNVGANSNVEHDRIFSRGDTASASALKNDEPFTKCFDIINILTKTYFIYSIHTSKQTTQFSFCLDHFPTDKLWKTAHVHVSRSSPSPWVHWNSPGLSLWGWCIPLHRWVKLSEWVRNYRIKDGGIGLKQMEEKKSEHSVKLWKCTVHLFCVHLIFHYIYWPMSGWWALREFVHITQPRLNSDHLVIFVLVLTTQGYSCSATFEDRHSSQLLVCSWIQKLLSIWRGN